MSTFLIHSPKGPENHGKIHIFLLKSPLRVIHLHLNILQHLLHRCIFKRPRAPPTKDVSFRKNDVPEAFELASGKFGELIGEKDEVDAGLSPVVGAVNAAHYEQINGFAGPGTPRERVVELDGFARVADWWVSRKNRGEYCNDDD
ncbi:hypothetical protein MMC29_004535 [Sticta canariensis]|nr:hypothetical protein [Sticta canariensis]